MDENPLTTTVLEPFRLVMRFGKCYYCGSSAYDDMYISDMFGIRHCSDHMAWAQRDCNAYLHKNQLVAMYDVKKSPVLQEFADILTTNPVHVVRSNGTIQSNWVIRTCGEYSFITDFITYSKGEWLIPMKHQTEDIKKHIPITKLLREENTGVLTKELVDQVVAVLEDGLYKSDSIEQQKYKLLSSDSTEPEESPNIQTVFCQGRECRVYMSSKI